MHLKISLTCVLSLGLVSCAVPASQSADAVPPAPLALAVTTPNPGWRLQIERVVERPDEVWILARLRREPGLAAQVIHLAWAEVPIALPAKPRRVFVAGKTWAWPNEEPYEFVPALEPLLREARGARVLFARDEK